jgi:hypothetical protein
MGGNNKRLSERGESHWTRGIAVALEIISILQCSIANKSFDQLGFVHP